MAVLELQPLAAFLGRDLEDDLREAEKRAGKAAA
jgi:hypothetical protein